MPFGGSTGGNIGSPNWSNVASANYYPRSFQRYCNYCGCSWTEYEGAIPGVHICPQQMMRVFPSFPAGPIDETIAGVKEVVKKVKKSLPKDFKVTSKLDHLPKDLREIADKILVAKFGS